MQKLKRLIGVPQPKSGKAKKKPSISKLKKKLWAEFSLYIRNRDKWTCFTCGKTHSQALERYLGNKNFKRTTDPRGGDFAVKKQYGNRLWYNKI